MDLFVSLTGLTTCLYGEAIPLQSLGTLTIRRASHVEPDAQGAWWADLSPSDGPHLGPFATRTEALDAEVHWLTEQLLAACDPART